MSVVYTLLPALSKICDLVYYWVVSIISFSYYGSTWKRIYLIIYIWVFLFTFTLLIGKQIFIGTPCHVQLTKKRWTQQNKKINSLWKKSQSTSSSFYFLTKSNIHTFYNSFSPTRLPYMYKCAVISAACEPSFFGLLASVSFNKNVCWIQFHFRGICISSHVRPSIFYKTIKHFTRGENEHLHYKLVAWLPKITF